MPRTSNSPTPPSSVSKIRKLSSPFSKIMTRRNNNKISNNADKQLQHQKQQRSSRHLPDDSADSKIRRGAEIIRNQILKQLEELETMKQQNNETSFSVSPYIDDDEEDGGGRSAQHGSSNGGSVFSLGIGNGTGGGGGGGGKSHGPTRSFSDDDFSDPWVASSSSLANSPSNNSRNNSHQNHVHGESVGVLRLEDINSSGGAMRNNTDNLSPSPVSVDDIIENYHAAAKGITPTSKASRESDEESSTVFPLLRTPFGDESLASFPSRGDASEWADLSVDPSLLGHEARDDNRHPQQEEHRQQPPATASSQQHLLSPIKPKRIDATLPEMQAPSLNSSPQHSKTTSNTQHQRQLSNSQTSMAGYSEAGPSDILADLKHLDENATYDFVGDDYTYGDGCTLVSSTLPVVTPTYSAERNDPLVDSINGELDSQDGPSYLPTRILPFTGRGWSNRKEPLRQQQLSQQQHQQQQQKSNKTQNIFRRDKSSSKKDNAMKSTSAVKFQESFGTGLCVKSHGKVIPVHDSERIVTPVLTAGLIRQNSGMMPSPLSIEYTLLLEDPAYLHAQNAGMLWQSLVGQQVRFPSRWYSGERTPPLGMVGGDATWQYLGRHQIKANRTLNRLVRTRASPGRLLLHVVVLDLISRQPMQDIAIGVFHPNARGIRTSTEPNKEEEYSRDVWIAVRKRLDAVSAVDTLLSRGQPWEYSAWKAPLGRRSRVTNDNVRAVFGEEPPLETLFVPEIELYERVSEVMKKQPRIAPAMAILEEFVFA